MEPIIAKHLRGSKSGQTSWFELGLNEELTIGRDPSNKLAFHQEEDDVVGRKHAKIVCQEDGFTIFDLNSRNGTFVNSERMTSPLMLKSGDVIEFGTGGPQIQFYSGKKSLAGPSTRIFRLGQPAIRPTRFVSPSGPTQTSENEVLTDTEPSGTETIITKHLRGSRSGESDWFNLELNEELTIGRDPSSTLAFHQETDDLVGRKHAKIIRQADSFVIVDMNSRNGTFVNYERIGRPTTLKSGDVIELGVGGPKIQFYLGKEWPGGTANGSVESDEVASNLRPSPTSPSSPGTVDRITAESPGPRSSDLPMRTVLLGLLAMVLFTIGVIVVTSYMKGSQPDPTPMPSVSVENPTPMDLFDSLATNRGLVFFATTFFVIAALMGLFVFRREND